MFMTKTGWATLEAMACDPKSPHRFRALELLAAYAYGRPTLPLAGDPEPDAAPLEVTVTFDKAGAATAPDQCPQRPALAENRWRTISTT
jgi:hypothetical protein